MQVLLIINFITIIALFLFIIRINKIYKNNMLAVTNKVDYLNLKIETMFKFIKDYKKASISKTKEDKKSVLASFDELDEIIIKYLEIN